MQKLLVALAMSTLAACFARGIAGSGGGGAPASETSFDASPEASGEPVFGATVSLDDSPPPISGGTMDVTPDGTYAVTADPDRDAIHVAVIGAPAKLYTLALQPGDEPGRVATDTHGRAHVVLRRAGAVVTIDVPTGTILARRNVCPIPRGVAYDPSSDSILVACATGELVTLPAGGGAATRTVLIERDLRDVVVLGGMTFVSTFRRAEVLRIDDHGEVVWRAGGQPQANVINYGARRLRAFNGKLWMLYQTTDGFLPRTPSGPPYYGTQCTSVVSNAMATIEPSSGVMTTAKFGGGLVVDFVVTIGGFIIVAAPGSGHTSSRSGFALMGASFGCASASGAAGQYTSVALGGAAATIVAQVREPAALVVAHGDSVDSSISLSDVSREDTGHAIFHSDTVAGIACASCHLEGDSDGIVWTIPTTSGVANLRTLSLLGTVFGTAPYHWQGEITDVPALLDDVYSHGMNGPKLDVSEKQALTHWLEALPPPARQAPTDVDAAARGQTLFEGTAGCRTCHAGDKMTDNLWHDVGTFAPLQTPSLVGVGTRSPLLHDGCALTLRDRFSLACRADTHGVTVAPSDVDDLVAYLETL